MVLADVVQGVRCVGGNLKSDVAEFGAVVPDARGHDVCRVVGARRSLDPEGVAHGVHLERVGRATGEGERRVVRATDDIRGCAAVGDHDGRARAAALILQYGRRGRRDGEERRLSLYRRDSHDVWCRHDLSSEHDGHGDCLARRCRC